MKSLFGSKDKIGVRTFSRYSASHFDTRTSKLFDTLGTVVHLMFEGRLSQNKRHKDSNNIRINTLIVFYKSYYLYIIFIAAQYFMNKCGNPL